MLVLKKQYQKLFDEKMKDAPMIKSSAEQDFEKAFNIYALTYDTVSTLYLFGVVKDMFGQTLDNLFEK